MELLDNMKLRQACQDHRLNMPSYNSNALLRRPDGAAVIISTEGVGPVEVRPGMAGLDTEWVREWQFLPIEAVEACRTGETRDLADHVRTFGDRLNHNVWDWYQWAGSPKPLGGDAA